MGEKSFETQGPEASGLDERDAKREEAVQKVKAFFTERLDLLEEDITTHPDLSKSKVEREKMLILWDATGDELLLAKHSGNRYESLKAQIKSILRDFESNNYSSAYLFLENEIAEFQKGLADVQGTDEDPALEGKHPRVVAYEELIAEAEELKNSLIIEE